MQTSSTPSPEDIDIMALGRAVRRSLSRLLLVAVALATLTYAVLSTMAPRYTSEAQLAIVAKSANPFPDGRADRNAGADPVTQRLDKEAINTHVRALMAPDLLLSVAEELDLSGAIEFNSAIGDIDSFSWAMRVVGLAGPRAGESEQDRVLGAICRQLEVSAARESRFIPIRFSSADPQLAAEFANRLAEAYRARLVMMPVEETSQVVSALLPKVELLKRELIEAEAEVERYRTSTDQFRGGAQNTLITDQRMAALADELTRTHAQRGDAEARWRTARELIEGGTPEIVPEVQKSPLVQNLIGQRVRLERQISEASASLLPAHPRMQQLNADLASLKRQIGGEAQRVIQSLEKDYLAATRRATTIAAEIEALKAQVVSGSGNEARLRALESSARAKRTELERLQKQLEDNKTVVNIRQVPIEAQIISRARVSSVPSFPRKGPYALLAMAAAMLLGLAVVVTREAAMASYGLAAQGAASRELSEPGEVRPALAQLSADAAANVHWAQRRRSGAPPGEPLAGVVGRLLARRDVTGGLRTIVAGSSAKLDARPEALDLARALAGAGKQVVLVGWSLTGQQLIEHIGDMISRPGVIQLLEGSAPFEEVVVRLPRSEAHVIDAGCRPIKRAAVLDPERLNMVLDALDAAYEQVLVTGTYEDLQLLFEAIEGRFDAAVSVLDGQAGSSAARAGDHLLGFEVAGIDIVHYERPVGEAAPSLQLAVGA